MTLAPPQPPNIPAGYAPVSADLTNWITTPFTFCRNLIVFEAEQTGTPQALTGSAFNQIVYNSIAYDPYSGWDNTNKWWLAPWSGIYSITLTNWIAATSVHLEAAPLITGQFRYELAGSPTPGAIQGAQSAEFTVPLIGGLDYVQGAAWVSGAVNTSTALGINSSIEITFVST